MRTVVAGLQPMSIASTGNGTPASSIRVQPVCRRSWNRHCTPARIFAASHASFQRPIGAVGYGLVGASLEIVTSSPVALRREHVVVGLAGWKVARPELQNCIGAGVQRNHTACTGVGLALAHGD